VVPEQIERETVIAAPVERVWALLTEAEHLGRWFGDAGAEIGPAPGGALRPAAGSATAPSAGAWSPSRLRRRFSYRWPSCASRRQRAGRGQLDAGRVHAAGRGRRHPPARGRERLRHALADPAKQGERAEDNRKGWGNELDELREYAERVAV
jgi:uncharacterized protein YndB with AHSA1/START domain